MTPRCRTAFTAAATCAALLGPAGAAHAASFTAIKSCYISVPGTAQRPAQRQAINLAGTGFTPGARVDVRVDGETALVGAPVDAAGNLGTDPEASVIAAAPLVTRQKPRTFQIVATEQGAPAPAATASAKAVVLTVSVKPRRALASRRVRFRGSGFVYRGPRVYAHYRHRGKTRKTVAFRKRGACGLFSARRPQFPFANPAEGDWLVQFDGRKRFRKRAIPRVPLLIRVKRTIKY